MVPKATSADYLKVYNIMRSLKVEVAERPIASAIAILALMLFVWFIKNLAFYRLHFQKLQSQGLPMPPHHILLGHLPILIRAVNTLPKDAHPLYITTQIRQMYPNLGPDFYLDAWPFADALLVLGSQETMHQIAFDHVLHKTHILKNFLKPLTRGVDIVSLSGPVWKRWRAIFNPGFNPAHLSTLVPLIVKETRIYCQVLDEHVAKQDVFEMKLLTDNLILDVIGQVAMGVSFSCQTKSNQVVQSLRTQVKWSTTGAEPNPLSRYNPFRPIVHWYHGRIVDNYILHELDERYKAWTKRQTADLPKVQSNRTAIDLAINAYAESLPRDTGSTNMLMDPYFRRMCQSQLKVFLFSGHDTTSSAICFHLWLLSQNPKTLIRLQEEHTKIFGSDPNTAADTIASCPHILNQLPYTTGVIKESLRLFPTVTTSRAGEVGFSVIDSQGRAFPTDNVVVFPNIHSCHHDPSYWPHVESFMPERWLAPPSDPLCPVKGMWRAFEQGPRNCIAQELAMIEMKIVLVLVSRTYTFRPAYDEQYASKGKAPPMILGQKAYQVDMMGPKGDLPLKVERLQTQ